MKIQNSSNTNSFNKTNFKGKTPHTAANFNPEKKIGIKEYKKQLQGLVLAGAAMLAALNISGCTVQAKESEKIQNLTPIEETFDNNDCDRDCDYDCDFVIPIDVYKDYLENIRAAKDTENRIASPTSTIIDTDAFSSIEAQKRFEDSKNYIEDAIKEYDNLYNEIWPSYTEASALDIIKLLDGKTFDGSQNDTEQLIQYQDENRNLKGFYEHYSIAQIAAGEITPWKDIETEKDAAYFIERLIEEASSDTICHPFVSDKSAITSKGNINKGELEIINKVLDEIEQINDETKTVAEIYRKELEAATLKSNEWMAENSLEAELSGLDGSDIKDYYVLIADHIKNQAEKIKEAKTAYKTLKNDFIQNQNKMPEDEKKEMAYKIQDALHKYESAVNMQIANGNLNPNLVNNNIEILEKYAKDVIKKAREQIFKPVKIINQPSTKDTNSNIESSQMNPTTPPATEEFIDNTGIGTIDEDINYSLLEPCIEE